jgi:hypothetical protein
VTMPRHKFTKEESQRGGRARCAQPSMKEAREKGFATTMDRHPFFARKWLKKQIKEENQARDAKTPPPR